MKSARYFFLVLVLCLSVLWQMTVSAAENGKVWVAADRAELLNLPDNYTGVSIANKNIVRVIKHAGNKVSLIGKKEGTTKVTFTKNGKVIWSSMVEVGPDVPELKRIIGQFFPSETGINVQWVNNSVALSGAVSDPEIAHRVVSIAQEYVGEKGKVINLMQIKAGQQVMLRVQIGEVQRGALDQLGFSLQGITGALTAPFYESRMFDLSTHLDSLSQQGVFKTLAEPNLIAISGESAEFLAGGEIPIPVPQGNETVTVQYKPFGVSLKFTPLVLSQNRIRLNVEPEVSELSSQGSVTMKGMKIPGLTSRRAKTTVELAPGESFMIAGLLRDDLRNVVDDMEPFADVPVLGALFRSSAFKRNESELVIAVTPYIVDPVVNGSIKLPTDDFRPASTLENYFLGAIGSTGLGKDNSGGKLEGSYGYMAQ
jgi:pilus assembly protein CpaC